MFKSELICLTRTDQSVCLECCERLGANGFFRMLGVYDIWTYTNNLMTNGKGSPFLGKEITKFLQSIGRKELKCDSYFKKVNFPIMSRDFCMIALQIAKYECQYVQDFVKKIGMLQDDPNHEDESTPSTEFAVVEELCKAALIPCTFRLVPEVTRASCLRGEAYDMKRHEFHAGSGTVRRLFIQPIAFVV